MSQQEFHDKKDLKNIIAESHAIQAEAAVQNAQNVDTIRTKIGRQAWTMIAVIIASATLFGIIEEYRVNDLQQQVVALNAKLNELHNTVGTSSDNKALKTQVNAMRKAIDSKNDQILSLHDAADQEEEKNAKYYSHMEKRADGYVDHIMSLNDQLESSEQNLDRFKTRNNTKKQFLEMALAIAANNPHQLKLAIEDQNLPEMRFYPLAVKMAIGLGSYHVLDYIQTVENWDLTIPQDLADHALNPRTVPLKEFQGLQEKYNQQAGRLNDIKKVKENLEAQVYDENYLPYSRERVMIIEAYHTVAENVRPLNLKKWIGTATPQQWVAYLRMAVARSSDNVYQAILEHHEVTTIPEVAAYIEATEVLAALQSDKD